MISQNDKSCSLSCSERQRASAKLSQLTFRELCLLPVVECVRYVLASFAVSPQFLNFASALNGERGFVQYNPDPCEECVPRYALVDDAYELMPRRNGVVIWIEDCKRVVIRYIDSEHRALEVRCASSDALAANIPIELLDALQNMQAICTRNFIT